MGQELGPQAADKIAEMPEEHTAEIIPIRPEAAESLAEEQDAQVLPLKPEFAEFTKPAGAEQNPQMAAEARAKIATIADLPTEQLINEFQHYSELSNASRRPNGERIKAKNQLTYGIRAMQRETELKNRGVNMDDIRQPKAAPQPEQQTSETAEAVPKKGLFNFLRRG